MAIERVPLWRRAGAGLALPVFNKEREALLIFYPSEARRFLFVHLFVSDKAPRLCWVTICNAISVGFPFGLPVTLRAIWSGFYGASVGFQGVSVRAGLGGLWGLAFILWGFGRVVAFGFHP